MSIAQFLLGLVGLIGIMGGVVCKMNGLPVKALLGQSVVIYLMVSLIATIASRLG